MGADTIGDLEHNVRFHIHSNNPWKYDPRTHNPRVFGGVNTVFLGDFWQLRPIGQIALMSSPFAQKAMENAKARQIMNMFWDPGISFSLQEWPNKNRMLHLDVNERSGQDVWFSDILDRCRAGALTEDDYNFLHGYPTRKPVEFWYHQRAVNKGHHTLPRCKYEPYCIHQYWQEYPGMFECRNCWQERKRRSRVLDCHTRAAQGIDMLTSPEFSEAILITQYNMAVFHFGHQRALNFARNRNSQAFWIQATDSPPNWYANGYSNEELLQQKQRWLGYNARKTQGILSALLACLTCRTE